MSSTPTVLIDGDPVVYRCGFAAQHSVIHALVEGPEGPSAWRFEGKADRNQWLKEHPNYEILSEEAELEVEPLEFALVTVRAVLRALEHLGVGRVFLSGKDNYREKLATIAPYKGNRDRNKRPVHYQAIRDYLVERWGAVVIDGREADDELSIRAAQARKDGRDYWIATIDKDLDQIPGLHWDYMRQVEYRVSEEEAQKWFWQQVLSGDATDGVPGCWKLGPAKAKERVDALYLDGYTPKEIWREVLKAYAASLKKAGCPYTDSDAAALETARLVWMQTEPGALWNPPGVPYGRIEGFDAE